MVADNGNTEQLINELYKLTESGHNQCGLKNLRIAAILSSINQDDEFSRRWAVLSSKIKSQLAPQSLN